MTAFFDFWKLTNTSVGQAKRVLLAQLRGAGQEGDDDSAESEDAVEHLFPLGFVSRPSLSTSAAGLQAFCVQIYDEVLALFTRNKELAQWSPPLEEGESRLYGAKSQAANVRARADGSVEINSDTGASKDVRLNGGTKRVARETDAVRVGTLAGTVAGGVVTFTFTPTNADGTPGVSVVGPTVTIAGVIANGGASNVKA